ncbi:DUF1642 domain-containing protein [Listeria monocytogenes]|uniref:DUF1642 domain-containing protein n=1 Tax=Listeria monocytogenes TaxID=1639 RepID=UPI001E2B8D9F|nr:DUF1642 domain-containing protein [Listeria monocytogenes]MCD7507378.1 DUF1642 domain-containing protein [Listeria monocytogenes]MCD7547131.1 DUF1642 domain-containing protein [Listeria monocytogenes]
MKFKEGDLIEVIWRSELYRGAVTRIVEATDEIEVKLAKKPLIDYLFKQSQVSKVKLVKVPQFVADWISRCKQKGYDLFLSIDYDDSDMPYEMYNWLTFSDENQEILARAWLDGYEVEKEPLYYVRLPIVRLNTLGTAVEGDYKYLWADQATGENNIFQSLEYPATLIQSGWKTKFTESEIKNIDTRYWDFAVPVEEVEETE